MNEQPHNIKTPLSSLFRDPLVRRAFKRAERDLGSEPAPTIRSRPTLLGGAAEAVKSFARRSLLIVGG